MKSSTILILMSLLSAIAFGQIATPPAAGDGSSGNPYQIATLENLYWLSQNSGEWAKDYIQSADIDASATETWELGDHDNDAGTADEYMGFSPIGDATIEFTGNYDGAGYTISGLTINRPGYDQIGLFGKTNGGIVNNVHIINANIEGKQYVGALVGYAYNETVTRCSTTGTISGTDKVGGLVGYLHGGGGAVDKCFSGGAISGFDMVGGLFGYFGESPLSDCYSRSSVQGDIYVGGFVGLLNATTATNCYCTGTVTGNTYTGGFNGFDYANSSSCFWDTETSGQNTSPEGTGKVTAEMTAQSTFTTAGWDFVGESTNGTDDVWGIYVSQNNGYPLLLGVTPMSLATSTSDASDIAANTATLNGSIIDLGDEGLIPGQHGFVWSTSENPTLNDNKSQQGPVSSIGAFSYNVTVLMPLTKYYVKAYATNAEGTSYGNEVSFITTPEGQGTQANPYLVPDLATLRWLSENSDQWDKYYLQTADIDASETTTWNIGDHDDNAGTPDEYMGFSPIGNDIIKFTGFYDGDGHTIDSMFINRLAFPYIGLFGNTNGATIQNLGMSNVDVVGWSLVGGLVGRHTSGTISNCFSTGNVSGWYQAGGLAGYAEGSSSNISNCYSRVDILGIQTLGGLIGYYNAVTLSNCYSTGNISGSANVGGLLGSKIGGVATASFWDTQTSGTTNGTGDNPSAGITGKTTSEMTTQSTFTDAGWDFVGETTNGTDDIWAMYSFYNNGYPVFDASPQAPAVESNAAGSITTTEAVLNGNVLNLGSEAVTQHGFVWSATNGPSLDDNFSEQGAATNTGAYTYSLSGLLPDKTYYVKTYATNAVGTSYGDEISFTTTSSGDAVYIDYNIRTDDFYAQTKESGIFQGNADPVWHFRGQAGASYSAGAWSSWDCLYDAPGSQAYGSGKWFNQNTEERWSGSILNNTDNIYIGIEGWEDEDQNYCTYNSGTDENYSSDSYDYHTNLDGTVTRATWENFKNTQQSNVDYVDCGTEGNDNYFKIEFDVWWDYSFPVDVSFSLSDATYDGFTININGFNNYRVNSWDYEIRDDGNNLIAELTGLEYSAVEVTGLDMGSDYYVKVRGTNEAGTGDYSSAQSIITLIPEIDVAASLNNFSTSLGTPSESQSFSVSGANLLDDISIAALGDFEYSTDDVSFNSSITLTQSNGTLAETTVYVRLAGVSAGIYDGDIVISSTSAQDQNVAATGETTSPNALNLDGSDDYVDCGNDASLQITGTAFTLEAWIKADTWADEVWKGTIISKESPGNGYFMRCGDNGLLNVGFGDGSNGHETTTSTGLMVLDRWYHLAGVYNGATLKLYINGAEVASENYTQSLGNSTQNLLIGESPFYTNRLFNGTIDEVRVWDIARTETEIHDNMYNELNGNETGLLAYYTFDQGNPGGDNTGKTILYDQTSNANNGFLTGPFALTGNSSNWVISGAFSPTLVWDGSESTDWANGDNWSNGYIPTENDHVLIQTTPNKPYVFSGIGASCNNLMVETMGFLTVQNGGSLITKGNITNNGFITMKNDISEGHWHLISIPTTGITANTFLTNYLQTWDETTPEWSDITDPEMELNTNTGYALWATASKSSYSFTGTPLTGTQIASVTLSNNFPNPAEGNDGANLLGNPYPSSIDWSGLDNTWGAVYYWDPAANSGTGDYIEWNDGVGSGSQYIPPMQGFFIVVDETNTTEGTGTFTLNNENRTHSGATGYYKSKIQNGIILEARSGNSTDEVFIRFKDDATNAFDLQTDALKFFSGVEGAAQIYAFGNSHKLAIDTRPETGTIQLGFANDESGFYAIAMTEADGISKATLEDTKSNTFHDLSKGAYEFAWNVTDDETRFKLHLNAVGIQENQFSESDILIYAADGNIYVRATEHAPSQNGIHYLNGTAQHAALTITDIMGRTLHQQEISGNSLTIIPVNYKTGVYIVTVRNGNQIKTEKLFIK